MPDERTFEVKRKWITKNSTIGELWIDGKMRCYTLEPPILPAPAKPRAIDSGQYKLAYDFSKRFARMLPHICDVPDFQGIRIHIGNYPNNTEGCILVGTERGTDCVLKSAHAFNDVVPEIEDACQWGEQFIMISDVEPELPPNISLDEYIGG